MIHQCNFWTIHINSIWAFLYILIIGRSLKLLSLFYKYSCNFGLEDRTNVLPIDMQKLLLSLWKKKCFTTSLITQFLKLQKTLAIHYICTLSVNKQVALCNSLYIWCNSLQPIYFQLLCNSIIIAPMMSCLHHWLSFIYLNLTIDIIEIFGQYKVVN